MSPTPGELVARGMSSKYRAQPGTATPDGARFELTDDEARMLKGLWAGRDRDLLSGLFAQQLTEYTHALRTVDVEQVPAYRARLAALEQFWGRLERTATALKEA